MLAEIKRIFNSGKVISLLPNRSRLEVWIQMFGSINLEIAPVNVLGPFVVVQAGFYFPSVYLWSPSPAVFYSPGCFGA